jgi:hypothetical protein
MFFHVYLRKVNKTGFQMFFSRFYKENFTQAKRNDFMTAS